MGDLPDKDMNDAPCHFGASEASAWASGYNSALEDVRRKRELQHVSNWSVARVLALRQVRPYQIRVKHWRTRCQAGEYDWDTIRAYLEKNEGDRWYQSRKSGHIIFGFASRDKLDEFVRRFNVKEEKPS